MVSELTPHLYGRADVESMARIYMDSIFVPNRRGNVRLDCFRLYEASACGAIAVVVGKQDEISETFAHEHNPPWIFAPSWSDAKHQMCHLMKDPVALQERQRQVVEWWKARVNDLRAVLSKTLM